MGPGWARDERVSTLVSSGVLPFHRSKDDHGPPPVSILSPLKNGFFLSLFIGALIGSFGARIGELTAVWFMTEMTRSPLLVSLVTSAFSVPGFLLALPAGVLGDVFDRRGLLLCALALDSLAMGVLALLTVKGLVGPGVLLTLCTLLGLFAAIISTTLDAILPQVVARKDLSAAIAVGGIRYHLSRAAGPVLGGLIITSASIGQSFLLCALLTLIFIVLLGIWRWPRDTSELPAERLGAALRAGLRYVGNAPQLTAVLIRVVAFIGVGSAMWALFPFYAKHHLGFNAFQYGVLFGSFGLGGTLGSVTAFALSRTRSGDTVLGVATLGFALILFLVMRTADIRLLAALMFFGGIFWSTGMLGLKTAIQIAAPEWVRARISALYLLALHAAVSVGSASWGLVASRYGTPMALRCAAVAMVGTLILMLRYRLIAVSAVTEDHLVPKLAPLELPAELAQDGVAVMITLEYAINPERFREFEELMHEVGAIRRRSGATFWGLFVEGPMRATYFEYFVVESGLDARRMHDRMTDPERELMGRAHAFHLKGERPTAQHHEMICYGGAWETHRPGR